MASTITFTGLASGLDTAAWVEALLEVRRASKISPIEIKQTELTKASSTLSSVQSTFNSFRTSMEKLTDSKFGGSFDLFSKTKTESSNSEFVTATSTSSAGILSHNISIRQLASATKVSSVADALAVSVNSKVSDLENGGTGTFSIYVDGNKHEIEVTDADTIDSVMSKINDIEGVEANFAEGKFSISATNGEAIVVGSSTDDFNVTKAFNLQQNEAGNFESYNILSNATSKSKVVDIFGEDAKGTFTIGKAEFTIDDDTTFESLINEINNSEDAAVNASFDSDTGQLVLESKNNGSFNINIQGGTSNFTDMMGYTQNNGTTLAAQDLGTFAIFNIDGKSHMSTSNTVGSDVTGIEGVTFTLKKVSDDENPTTTIDVKQDTSDLISAIKSFVSSYNSAITSADKATAVGADLNGESALVSIRNSLRRTATAKDEGADSAYSILASIGITTGAVTNDMSELTDNLSFDEDKFLEAFAENPNAVKELLIGGENNEGVLNKLHSTVDQSLSASGYFSTRHNSFDRSISNYSNKLSSEMTKLSDYQARLESQYAAMEEMILSFQSAYNSAMSQISG